MPDSAETRDFHGQVMNTQTNMSVSKVLLGASPTALRVKNKARTLEIVSNHVLVDVDFCAKNNFNTGIQRVTRNTIQNFPEGSRYLLTCWNSDHTSLRLLTELEKKRVLEWSTDGVYKSSRREFVPNSMIIPWESTYFAPEVPSGSASIGLQALSEYSGNKCVAIGYDTIPLTSPSMVTSVDTEKFMNYLSAIKFFDKLICISESAAMEFAGFFQMLESQDIPSASIISIPLPIEKVKESKKRINPSNNSKPLILSVGTIEPRKNQFQLLQACRDLNKMNVPLRLRFVGNVSPALSSEFLQALKISKKEGLDVEIFAGISDNQLSDLYKQAQLTVFISLHEGYGLPVAESLAQNVPVITSNTGALAEFSSFGGVLTVDPKNLTELSSEISKLMQAPQELELLRSQIKIPADRTWPDYSRQIWEQITSDE